MALKKNPVKSILKICSYKYIFELLDLYRDYTASNFCFFCFYNLEK